MEGVVTVSDGFFDVPAGYRDADLEMAALEARGNELRRMWRPFSALEREQLEAGAIVSKSSTNRETGEKYRVNVRYVDGVLEYALPEASAFTGWRESPRLARLAVEVAEKMGV